MTHNMVLWKIILIKIFSPTILYSASFTIAVTVDPQNGLNATIMEEYVDLVRLYLQTTITAFETATIMSSCLTFFAIFRFLANHKKLKNRMRQGKYRKLELPTPSELLTGNFKFQAYQTAYISWGFAFQVSFDNFATFYPNCFNFINLHFCVQLAQKLKKNLSDYFFDIFFLILYFDLTNFCWLKSFTFSFRFLYGNCDVPAKVQSLTFLRAFIIRSVERRL